MRLEAGDRMRAYIAIKFHADHRNRQTIEQISSVLERHGIEAFCFARDVEKWGQVRLTPKQLMARSFAEIDASDLLIVDLTEKGVGIGIEAGYAFAGGLPIVTIARTGADISETLRGISRCVVCYDDPEDLARFFSELPDRCEQW